ncbi:hypothetical protein H5J25_03985 [Sphingomonas aliaeris]|uniref:Uncharacterized protein n=1 Tax=Sphingomonas aliaeris TaxID=2759526 RepID=A0A974NW56_9SPHN|nr:hypothetical protein [Sphingomonas aliaeris]QQV77918.1 hypothetical protein H5J25_03985 [Sphingomonas aliaeris]
MSGVVGIDADPGMSPEGARLAMEMRMFPLAVCRARQALFRRNIELNVRSATPLLDIVAKATGLELSDVACDIRPPPGWPIRSLQGAGLATLESVDRQFSFTPKAILRRHRKAGLIVRWDPANKDVIGVRIVGNSIEMTVVAGPLQLDTLDGRARLRVPWGIPATLAAAMPGRPVSQIVEHPWLQTTSWPVVAVIDDGGATVLTFQTGHAAWPTPTSAEDSYGREPA